MIALLVVDDHREFRDAVADLLADEADMVVIGNAADGVEAVALAGRLGPDVVIMDLAMPGLDGFEAIRRITTMPHCKILAVSLSCEGDVARRALSAGADGFICKGDVAGRLPAAIRTVASGATCAPRSDAVPTADGGGPVT